MSLNWPKSLYGVTTGKRQKNLGNRSWKKKRRNLVENYQENLQLNYYMDGREEDTYHKWLLT